jgi:hypothetical protein
VCFGPASPDAGVELLRQLFLQCTLQENYSIQTGPNLSMGQLSTENFITGHHAVASLINICVALANHPVRGEERGGNLKIEILAKFNIGLFCREGG